ncbi:MAG TPA: Gfo/Idh/MocA family oxidoreductase [Candidatus Brocadiia bacterium]|nr:Gfo/Idh/MocA family oxidoreductase [Candidatus Brocadiia bacterium]
MDTVRWGILGTGSIAKKFARGLQSLPDAEIAAVGSRSEEKAESFGNEFNVPRRHASYEALCADRDVDIIYVATPHPLHCENALLCLKKGKAVLCEKPFAVNARQAGRMIAKARAKGLFLMEGMWTRFFPLMAEVRRIQAEGDIGEIRMLEVDFGFRCGWNPESRLLNPALAGGSLLDVGVYCNALAFMLFGKPDKIVSQAHIGATGVDEQAAWVMKYPKGQIAVCSSAVQTSTPMEATISGTEGRIRIHGPWWIPQKMTVQRGGKVEDREFPIEGNGMNYEAASVMACLRNGQTENPIIPLDETLEIARTMDALRKQWGLKYPFE